MFGRKVMIPRLEAWVGEPGIRYHYSGQDYTARGWPAALEPILERLQQEFSWQANSALLNYYRSGQDSVGLHADDEPELGPNPTIAILSVGAMRKLSFKPKDPKQGGFQVGLPPGGLLLMTGATQTYWKHAINKVSQAEARISCTFRQIVSL